MSEYQSYYEMYSYKMSKCKSKKDYKKLCKNMIRQYDTIDHIDYNLCKILSEAIGSDTYAKCIALALKMYLLEQQGIQVDTITLIDYKDNIE